MSKAECKKYEDKLSALKWNFQVNEKLLNVINEFQNKYGDMYFHVLSDNCMPKAFCEAFENFLKEQGDEKAKLTQQLMTAHAVIAQMKMNGYK